MYHYEMNEQVIKKEKAAARDLRKSRWWQTKIATRATCHYCMKSLKKDECTMDHVLPIVRGGRSTKGNVVISCKECNNQKKDKLIMDVILTEGKDPEGGVSPEAQHDGSGQHDEAEESHITRLHKPGDQSQE